jgi:hypothetical protein
MLGMITTAAHKRIVAEKDAEIAGLMRRLDRADARLVKAAGHILDLKAVKLPENALLVLDSMFEDYGYSASYISSMTGVPEKEVMNIIRGFAAYGWAYRHPFHNEDDCLIRGSGYSLNNVGAKVRAAIHRSSKP